MAGRNNVVEAHPQDKRWSIGICPVDVCFFVFFRGHILVIGNLEIICRQIIVNRPISFFLSLAHGLPRKLFINNNLWTIVNNTCKVMSQKAVHRHAIGALIHCSVYEDRFNKSIDVQWLAFPYIPFLAEHNLRISYRKYWKHHRNSVDSHRICGDSTDLWFHRKPLCFFCSLTFFFNIMEVRSKENSSCDLNKLADAVSLKWALSRDFPSQHKRGHPRCRAHFQQVV